MSETVKLIIEIPKDRYTDILRIADVQIVRRMPTLEQVVAHGIPLDNDSERAETQAYFDGEAIEALKGGWIPVEERNPNEYDDVLVSTDIEEVFEATYYGDELGFDDNNGNFYEGEVIAWQPKPKPYKENNT